jgi:CPA1 family monovalent cation:H+ antiporter
LGWSIERIEILLLIAAVVAMAAQKLRLPYTAGLVAAGAVLALTRYVPDMALTRELIFTAASP